MLSLFYQIYFDGEFSGFIKTQHHFHQMNKLSPITLAAILKTTLLAMVMLASGCGDHPPKLSSEEGKAFESAPPEVKQVWDKALAADKSNDYVAAQIALDSLSQMTLNDLQKKALSTERDAFGQRLMRAVNKNDPAAIQAVQNSQKNRSRR